VDGCGWQAPFKPLIFVGILQKKQHVVKYVMYFELWFYSPKKNGNGETPSNMVDDG